MFAYIIIFVIVLLFIYMSLRFYFSFKKEIYTNGSSNYPIVLAMTLLFTIILGHQYSLFEIILEFLNYSDYINIDTTQMNSNSYIISLFVFSIFSFGVIYIYYYKKASLAEKHKIDYVNYEIEYPKDEYERNPNFYIRVKELFELKYINQDLNLEYDSEQKLLYGSYTELSKSHVYMMFCDDENSKIDTNMCIDKLNYMKELKIHYLKKKIVI